MKHVLSIFAAFAALAACAITTTLEYEDARETLTRAAVSNDLAQAVRSATNTLAQALADGTIEVRAATARSADEADVAGVAGMAYSANGLYGENSERTADEIFTSIDAAASTNALQDAELAGKADITRLGLPVGTTQDVWVCNWSGEILPFRIQSGPALTWQQAYGTTPALIHNLINGRWQLNTQGSTVLTVTGAATASALDFGNGYTLTRKCYHPVAYTDDIIVEETDPTVPAWAKTAQKPSYTAAEVGALGNTGNQNLNGNLSFWNGNLAFEFWDAVLQPVIRVWNDYIEFPSQSGKLALTSDVPSLSGQTFNFATTQGVMDALKTVIEALGGTVTNAPSTTISQGE